MIEKRQEMMNIMNKILKRKHEKAFASTQQLDTCNECCNNKKRDTFYFIFLQQDCEPDPEQQNIQSLNGNLLMTNFQNVI